MMTYHPAPKKPTPWLVPLSGTVFVGYIDIAAAGSRALLGLRGIKEVLNFEIPDLPKVTPCCINKAIKKPAGPPARKGKASGEKPLTPFMVYNCKFKQYSLIIINTHLSASVGHAVAKYLADAFSDSYVRKVFVLSALRLDHLDRQGHCEMFENTWNGMCPGTEYPELPKYMKIFDPLLCDMIQMFCVEGIPFSVISLPAHRADSGFATEMDGSYEVSLDIYSGNLIALDRDCNDFGSNKTLAITKAFQWSFFFILLNKGIRTSDLASLWQNETLELKT
ncbi:hypothetical protein PoB_006255800 [Plakobranchus ocellatus]|uniref:Proteasome assembly chaperone 2 n=1 Tax=Plakobranchus ocellatus TaxID=259542 RepID=A0AAV4CW06_9GAST|nr:hypothetical protein PoB_006255800 [Plakobranchus ocellatus]